MKYTRWVLADSTQKNIDALLFRGLNMLSAIVLSARGFSSYDEADAFFSIKVNKLHDPFLMADMERAADRIERAVESKESIAVYGDYDVDGITSVCLMVDYLRGRGAAVRYYIPDRAGEGYGLNSAALVKLHEEGVTLVITVDSGITAIAEIASAVEMGLDVIVTDHHECRDVLPPALAVVNPKRHDSGYPFASLAGVGVVFKLLCALEKEHGVAGLLKKYGDLTAMGTVADVMPLVDENRVLVKSGLKIIEKTRNIGLRALIREAGVRDKRITSTVIGFTLASRVNAAGRMGNADIAAELFLSEDTAGAALLAQELCEMNTQRQNVESDIFAQAIEMIAESYGDDIPAALVLVGEGWQSGVVGIVASRLVERYQRPVYLISLEGGIGKGSARSTRGINLVQTLEECSGLLLNYGGHELAAGFSIEPELTDTFRQQIVGIAGRFFLGGTLETELHIDARVPAALLTMENARGLQELEPFGTGNEQPVFELSCAAIRMITAIGGGKHIRLRVECDGMMFTGVYFGMEVCSLGCAEGDIVDVAFNLEINHFRDEDSIQLMVRDIRLNKSELMREQAENKLYSRFTAGEDISPEEAAELLPSRDEMTALWKYLKNQRKSPVVISPEILARTALREAGLKSALHRTKIALDVLEEFNIIETEEYQNVLRISVNFIKGKADLSTSKILQLLTMNN